MSISNAMASGVSGLLANSTAVSSISYNIANADTVGYRRSFEQMVTSGVTATGAMSTGVQTTSIHRNTDDGNYLDTAIATNLAISGGGFFVVNSNIEASYATGNMFTRTGSFEPDQDGNLVNSAGMYLMGYAYGANGTLGGVDRNSFADLEPVNVAARSISGSATAGIGISGNLPAQETGQLEAGDPFVSSIEYYNALGGAERLTLSFQPTATANSWQVRIHDDTTDYGEVTVTFADSGATAGAPQSYADATALATAPAGFAFDPVTGTMSLTIDNGTTPQTIDLTLGAPGSFDGLSQFAGDYSPLAIEADGAESGVLARVEFDEFGNVWGIFDNGARSALYQVPLATFSNANGLETANNSTFTMSAGSGGFYLGQAGDGETGTLTSGGVESANVDIAQELTSLIQRQRAYSSNAKIITTADEMLSETVNIKR
ncbi:flagellar hook-basal body complex protein [Marinovum sp.]|uniref:flagellar hook protein FlgE n=1 Tax=Marinovum sp. TaxID=2024839 RepID=UPI002B276095|nr:flagellar hook-basal body complex protein [Marinovum sp.]